MAREITYLDAIREALREEMRRDPQVFVLGEDVGVYGRLRDHEGPAGGVRRVPLPRHADPRVVHHRRERRGVAARVPPGGRDAVRRLHHLRLRPDCQPGGHDGYRYGGRVACPIVVRAPVGGNVAGGLYHSQNPESWFVHRPGLKVVAPSTAWDAKGLLKAAIRDNNPVIYLEHKYLYRRAKGPCPKATRLCRLAKRRSGARAATSRWSPTARW